MVTGEDYEPDSDRMTRAWEPGGVFAHVTGLKHWRNEDDEHAEYTTDSGRTNYDVWPLVDMLEKHVAATAKMAPPISVPPYESVLTWPGDTEKGVPKIGF